MNTTERQTAHGMMSELFLGEAASRSMALVIGWPTGQGPSQNQFHFGLLPTALSQMLRAVRQQADCAER